MKRFVGLLLLLFASASFALEPPPDLEALPDLPEPSTEGRSDEAIEPEVTIRRTDREIIEEYRVNGRLYMVKVVPKWGVPYYFVDMDGDGFLETQRSGFDSNVLVPQWILFSW